MKKILAFSLMAALVLASCSPQEKFAPSVNQDVQTIRATISSETRTALVEDGDLWHVVWKAGDVIRCSDNKSTNVLYETTADGVSSAVFTPVSTNTESLSPDSTRFFAFYPPEIYTSGNNGKLPAVQHYVAGSLDHAPMRGNYNRGEFDPFAPAFVFRNLCGGIQLNLTSSQADVKVVRIVLAADKGLSGGFSASTDAPAAAMTSATATVSLDCPEIPVGAQPVPFFISVPESSYASFSVTVLASDGRMQTRSLKAGETLTIERARITPIDLAFDNLQKPAVGATATFATGANVNVAIKSLVNPDVTSQSDLDSTVRRMVFVTNSDAFSAVNVADSESESPIYAFYDEATATVTVSTPAPKFVLNANSSHFFAGFGCLTEIEGIDEFDTSNVTSLSYFFRYTPQRTVTMPATWDYSKLETVDRMFQYASSESIDVSNMNFESVTTMEHMFAYASELYEVVWPAEVHAYALTSMASMFRESAISLADLSMFTDTDALSSIRYMFAGCPNLQKVIMDCPFDAINPATGSGTTGAGYLFNLACESSGSLDLTEFNVSSLPVFSYMFYNCRASTINLSTWSLEAIGATGALRDMFHCCINLSTLYLGPDFIASGSPVNFFIYGSDGATAFTSSASGALTIYCTQATADWLVTTTLRYLYWGYNDITATPISFFSIENPAVSLTVTWKAI